MIIIIIITIMMIIIMIITIMIIIIMMIIIILEYMITSQTEGKPEQLSAWQPYSMQFPAQLI